MSEVIVAISLVNFVCGFVAVAVLSLVITKYSGYKKKLDAKEKEAEFRKLVPMAYIDEGKILTHTVAKVEGTGSKKHTEDVVDCTSALKDAHIERANKEKARNIAAFKKCVEYAIGAKVEVIVKHEDCNDFFYVILPNRKIARAMPTFEFSYGIVNEDGSLSDSKIYDNDRDDLNLVFTLLRSAL